MQRVKNLNADEAEALAIQALTFLAAEPERIGRFLTDTGIGPASLRATARDPQFLAAVLEYLVVNESLLRGFADEQGIDPATVTTAHLRLSGPQPSGD